MAVAAGIEPTTCSLGESRSIQLSYATVSVSLLKKQKEPAIVLSTAGSSVSFVLFSGKNILYSLFGKKSSCDPKNGMYQ